MPVMLLFLHSENKDTVLDDTLSNGSVAFNLSKAGILVS